MVVKKFILTVDFRRGEKDDGTIYIFNTRGCVLLGVTPKGELFIRRDTDEYGRTDDQKKVVAQMQEIKEA